MEESSPVMEAIAFMFSPLGFLVITGSVVLVGYLYLYIMAKAMQPTRDHASEGYFPIDSSGSRAGFTFITEPAEVTVSVVVPAYNEQERLPAMMDEMLQYLQSAENKDKSFTSEIIVVNDGSKDGTEDVVMRYVQAHGPDKVRFLNLHRNHGKGGAVRKGAMRSRGQYILMADADGATVASELGPLLARLQDVASAGQGIVVGSRAHLAAGEDKAARSPFRKFLMWGFHLLMGAVLGGSTVQDTQCGFKLFTRATAARIFPAQHIERWAFDVELLFLASTWGDIPVAEVAVQWSEIDGSKVDVVWDTMQMARDLVLIRASYLLGLWDPRPDQAGQFKDKAA